MKAEVRKIDGVVRLLVNGEIIPPDAYITYFTRNAHYQDFAGAGYRLFSLPVFFSSKTLNENSQAPCLGEAIFDGPEPRWEVLDADFHKIIDACPDALIFPRINVSLNETWELANPDELCDTGRSEPHRPCFSSDRWAQECMRLYGLTIDHIAHSDYAGHVIGYQFAAGNTEEWFPHDFAGSVGKRSREKFAEYCAENGLEGTEAEYYGFLSRIVADRICALAAFTKERAGRNLLAGTFYGYTLETPWRESCHHALGQVLDCPDIDFLCSPVSYGQDRTLGRDHGCMLPCDSLREHGKLYFAENDTRTHLTYPPFPELPYFQNPVFQPRKFEDTVEMLRLHYARALIHGYAHWWFDMWGGWYDDPVYMGLMKDFLRISRDAAGRSLRSVSELAVFIDEAAFRYLPGQDTGIQVAYNVREALGRIGTPYECFLAGDYERVRDRFRAVVLLEPYRTPLSAAIAADAKARGTGCLTVGPDNCGISPEELRSFCRACGVHLYSEKDAVVFVNESYLFLHTCTAGTPGLKLPGGKKLIPLLGGEQADAPLPEKHGVLFEIV